jgi:hypothetical protein
MGLHVLQLLQVPLQGSWSGKIPLSLGFVAVSWEDGVYQEPDNVGSPVVDVSGFPTRIAG